MKRNPINEHTPYSQCTGIREFGYQCQDQTRHSCVICGKMVCSAHEHQHSGESCSAYVSMVAITYEETPQEPGLCQADLRGFLCRDGTWSTPLKPCVHAEGHKAPHVSPGEERVARFNWML